jgi:methyl-accepting chemotaxis protein
VNIVLTEMDKITQQNAANAEESASASKVMNAQSEQMKGTVNDLVARISGDASTQLKRPQVRPKKSTKPVRPSTNPVPAEKGSASGSDHSL